MHRRGFGRKNSRRTMSVLSETLECRQLLSAANPVAYPVDIANPADIPAGSATPTGYSPTQITTGYGIKNISFDGITGTGAGQTIAIIVAYDNPALIDSTASNFSSGDLHKFDQAMGLSDPPSFTKVDEFGNDNLPTTVDPGWANESALDVEWTHAIAPQANIILVEAYSPNLSDLMSSALEYVTSVPSVSVVTMSFAVSEFSGETTYDSYFSIPTGHQGITFLAASGDNGSVGAYPAFSPDVVAVGATTLDLTGNNYTSETGLSNSGGGISQFEPKPSYQFAETQSSTMRTTPDVSVVGDKNTGVDVYDSINGGSGTPWYKVGGTSASTPIWGGLMAITDQARAKIGLGSLDGVDQTLPRLYELNSADFHDITSGNNGYAAGAGYDLVTGLGSPIANKLVNDLAGGNSVSGTVFNDTNADGSKGTSEGGLASETVYIDLYDSGVKEGADPIATTNSSGGFVFNDLPGGTFKIEQLVPAGATLTTAASHSVTLGYNSSSSGVSIGFQFVSAAQLAFSQQPSAADEGSAISPAITVKVEDALGDVVTTDNSAVTLAVTGGAAQLGGTDTVNAVNGIATFTNVTVLSTGSYTLTASDGTLTDATSLSVLISAASTGGTPSQLAFSQQPVTVAAGAVISPAIVVQVEDSLGNVVTTDLSPVTLSIASGPAGATLGGTVTVNAVNGIATFSDITVSTVGTVKLTASDSALTTATSDTFTVTTPPPVGTQLAFAEGPSDSTVNQSISPPIVVDVEDASGDLVSTDDSAVTLTLNSAPSGGTISGTTTVNAIDGVATFGDITLSETGDYILSAIDSSLTSATSNLFRVSPVILIPTAVSFFTQPTGTTATSTIRPSIVVNVIDSSGATVTTDGSAVTLSIASGPAGGTLGGTTTVTAADGTAVFTDISLSTPGDYVLTASDGSLSPVNSGSFTIATLGDLAPTITSAKLPTTLVATGTTSGHVSLNVSNQAATRANGLVTVAVEAVNNTSTVVLGQVKKHVNVLNGKSTPVTVPITSLPAGFVGTFSLEAVVTDLAGNTHPSSLGETVVGTAPVITLSPTKTVLKLPTSVVAGAKTSAHATVKITNEGNILSSGMTTVGIYAEPSDQSSSPELINSVTRFLRIAFNHSAAVSVPLKQFPSDLNNNYTLIAEVEDPKANTTSAQTGVTTIIAAAYVSLSTTGATVSPVKVKAGKTAVVTLTIENDGNVATNGAATIHVGTPAQADFFEDLSPVIVIPAGHKKVLHLRFTIPSTTAAGVYVPQVTYIQNSSSVLASGTAEFEVLG